MPMDSEDKTPPPPTDDPMERPRRMRVFKGAHAAFNQEHSAVPCVVRDLSETGAKIEFNLGWIVPSNFTLFVELDSFKVECEKVWHKGDLYGVRFTGPRIPTDVVRKQRVDLYDARNAVDETETTQAPTPSTSRHPKKPVFGKFK
ncbi:PilZ domain-containing protein [Rhizobium sp. C4]|uniref:PilZ domain-containing protein n=1 Tax=Rhizobium sp. C4 TaxID=1349800 RepID=UPI001E44B80E|nr:PilZ domain-containing protein [Rhizobium sp. C4]MCD2171895.1 PilZ domain-containing protein [Rhizobium sp. C4]